MLNTERIAEFSAALRGHIVQPDDAGYDASRKVYNAMIDRHPRLIVYCRDVADVMLGVNFARGQSLLLAVRGGGHNGGGLGTCDEGLVLDLRLEHSAGGVECTHRGSFVLRHQA